MRIWLKSKLRSNSPTSENPQNEPTTPHVDKLANSNRRKSMYARPSRSTDNGDQRRRKSHTATTSALDPEPEDRGVTKPDPLPTTTATSHFPNPCPRTRSKSRSGRRPPSPPAKQEGDGRRREPSRSRSRPREPSRSRSRPRARSKSAPRDKTYRSMNSAPMDGTMDSSGGRSSDRTDRKSSIPRSKSGGHLYKNGVKDDAARRRSRSCNSKSEL